MEKLIPQRPLTVKTRFTLSSLGGGLLFVVIGLAATAGYLGWQSFHVLDLLHIQARWDRAVPTEAEVAVDYESRLFIFDSYDLEIEYVDPDGNELEAETDFYTFFGGPDIESGLAVRYDPEEPERPVVSWALEFAGARWRAVAFMILGGLLVSVSFLVLGFRAISRWRSAVLAGQASVEAHCPITAATVQKVRGQEFLEITFTVPVDPQIPVVARARKHKTTFRGRRPPLYAAADESSLVVLIPDARPTAAVPLSEDMHPYLLSPAQQKDFTARSERHAAAVEQQSS